VVKRCDELPGQHLFQYVDGAGERRNITSDDVNQYLREASGGDFTAKDFRTWAATVLATCVLRDLVGFESETEARRDVVVAIDAVADKLGHTRAICRRSYLHPAVIETYLDGPLTSALGGAAIKTPAMLRADEAAALALLKRAAGRKVSKAAPRLYQYGPRRSSTPREDRGLKSDVGYRSRSTGPVRSDSSEQSKRPRVSS
jgi:DNA topoisomerase I